MAVRQPTRPRGFTLIELMIVVAMTGILVSLAVSAYRTYTVRAQVAEGIGLAANGKAPVAEAFRALAEAPADRAEAGMSANAGDTQGRYVSSVAVVNGRLDIAFGNSASASIGGRTLSLTPYETPGLDIVWICGNRIPGTGLKPMGFSGGGNQAVQIPTTVEARYLPAACR